MSRIFLFGVILILIVQSANFSAGLPAVNSQDNPGFREETRAVNISIGGWSLDYAITASDGLQIFAAEYEGRSVFTSIKLVEWHADLGNFGYVFSTGSAASGGGFAVFPYGDPQIVDLVTPQNQVVGFEVVQDFRMDNWGAACNERFEQRFQFFLDGRFRVVSGAYGQGCAPDGIYRPVVRIDIAVAGDAGDSFLLWNGAQWLPQPTEGWWLQPSALAPGGFAWRINDSASPAYFIAPGAGQFADGGRGDDALIYASLHHASEGDTDMAVIGTCCQDDQQQGPDQFLNGESIAAANLVLWYVPQMQTDSGADDGDDPYCWTVAGEPDPETYPCFSGPMFVPARLIYVPLAIR